LPPVPPLPSESPSIRRLPPLSPFAAFRHRNFQIFFSGYVVSLIGIWMQRVAQSWLVLDLTGSAFYVGLVEALGSIPVLFFALYAGAVADRVDRLRMVFVTQTAAMLLAFAYAALAFSDRATITAVIVIATLTGLTTAFDIPARQSFFVELVGKEDLTNAIALNSSAFNATRVVGPAMAGLLIGVAGVAACFLFNAVSFLAVLGALFFVKVQAVRRYGGKAVSAWANIREGLAYVFTDARIRKIILNIAVLGIFGFPALVLLPVLAKNVLGRGAETYGLMMSVVGAGAVFGALGIATFARHIPKGRILGVSASAYGALLVALALARPLALILVILALLGFAMIVTTALTNTLLQLLVPDQLRGRVISVYTFAFVGMTPLGSFQMGWVADRLSVRAAFAIGGAVTVAGALLGIVRAREVRETQ
jgi:MFS family permease